MEQDGELLRGNTPTLILAVLSGGPLHGYAIAREINQRSANALSLKQGALYPALHGLERDDLIVGGWEMGEGERPRKVYQITEVGRKELARRFKAWTEFSAAVESVLGGALHEQTT